MLLENTCFSLDFRKKTCTVIDFADDYIVGSVNDMIMDYESVFFLNVNYNMKMLLQIV